MFGLALVALGVSVYLSYVGLTGSKIAGCSGDVIDCSHVLTSRWSKVAGWPVALPAVGLYVTLLSLLGYRQVTGKISVNGGLLFLSTSAALAGIWFTALQIFDLGHFCPYCLVAHACGLSLAVIAWCHLNAQAKTRVGSGILAMAGVSGLVATQLLSEPPKTYEIEYHAPVEIDGAMEDIMSSPTADDILAPPAPSAPADDAGLFESPIGRTDAQDQEFASPLATTDNSRSVNALDWLSVSPISFLGVLAVSSANVEDADSEQSDSADEESKASDGEKVAKAKPAPPRRLVPVAGGSVKLNAADWPLYGDVDDKIIIAEMFDYTCEHCRRTHKAIKQAKELTGGNMAVLALPVPLHRSCNPAAKNNKPGGEVACELAKISIAVWLTDRSQFAAMHDWIFATKPTASQARSHAESLVDPAQLRDKLASDLPAKFVSKHVYLYQKAGQGALPKIMFPNTTLVGEIGSGKTIVDLANR
ncbi:MAG: vitamin K epoxide reductase family protein [Planctomycetota bacterium]